MFQISIILYNQHNLIHSNQSSQRDYHEASSNIAIIYDHRLEVERCQNGWHLALALAGLAGAGGAAGALVRAASGEVGGDLNGGVHAVW